MDFSVFDVNKILGDLINCENLNKPFKNWFIKILTIY